MSSWRSEILLKKDYDNLLTMDLICHGVNSPLLFKKYIVWLEKQKNFKIKEYNFRSKLAGWALNFSIKTDSKEKCIFAMLTLIIIDF